MHLHLVLISPSTYRAFIAASRRKDRSLDARIESANRASLLHKKRTGKALYITKEIVEKEAMYEEVDERYQEKRIRMLQAQNMQIEEQFHRHLLAAFAARTNSNNINNMPRRHASLASRHPMNQSGVRKMSLDLSNCRASYPGGMRAGPLTSPSVMSDHMYGFPSSGSYSQGLQSPSYMSCGESYFSATPTTSSSPVQSYVAQPGQPVWPQSFANSWACSQQQNPYLHAAAGMWQQDFMKQPQQIRQFRDRVASVPEIALQGLPSATVDPASSSSPHTRVQSEPVCNIPSEGNTPKPGTPSTETPGECPTPTPITPISPNVKNSTTKAPEQDSARTDRGCGLMVSNNGELDPDFDEFSRFAFGLGRNSYDQQQESFGFDDLVAFDDFATTA